MDSMKLPRAILFDWDDTLAENCDGITAAYNAALSAFGLPPITRAEVRARSRQSLRQQFPPIFGDHWEKAKDIFYSVFAMRHIDLLRAMPGAPDLLRELRRRGIYMAVVSNKNGNPLREEVSALGWDAYFGKVVGATDAPADKPDPQVVAMALDGSGLSPGPDIWFAGDKDSDLICAANAGCVPVLVSPEEVKCQVEPVHHLPDCDAFKFLIARMFDTICL